MKRREGIGIHQFYYFDADNDTPKYMYLKFEYLILSIQELVKNFDDGYD